MSDNCSDWFRGLAVLSISLESKVELAELEDKLYQRLPSADCKIRGIPLLHAAIATGSYKICKRVLSARPESIDSRSHTGELPISVAAKYEDVDIFRLLLDSGADAETADSFGRSTPVLAVIYDSADVLDYLMQSGKAGDPVYGIEGYALIHLAVINQARGAIELLVAISEQREAKTKDGLTALDLALIFDWEIGVSICLAHGMVPTLEEQEIESYKGTNRILVEINRLLKDEQEPSNSDGERATNFLAKLLSRLQPGQSEEVIFGNLLRDVDLAGDYVPVFSKYLDLIDKGSLYKKGSLVGLANLGLGLMYPNVSKFMSDEFGLSDQDLIAGERGDLAFGLLEDFDSSEFGDVQDDAWSEWFTDSFRFDESVSESTGSFDQAPVSPALSRELNTRWGGMSRGGENGGLTTKQQRKAEQSLTAITVGTALSLATKNPVPAIMGVMGAAFIISDAANDRTGGSEGGAGTGSGVGTDTDTGTGTGSGSGSSGSGSGGGSGPGDGSGGGSGSGGSGDGSGDESDDEPRTPKEPDNELTTKEAEGMVSPHAEPSGGGMTPEEFRRRMKTRLGQLAYPARDGEQSSANVVAVFRELVLHFTGTTTPDRDGDSGGGGGGGVRDRNEGVEDPPRSDSG